MKAFAAKLVAWGPPGLFLLTLLDSAGVPIPGVVDALLIFLASKSPSLAFLYAGLALVGSVLGCLFLFFLARKGGEKFLDKHTSTGRGARFRAWYVHYGLITVFIPAVSVIPMPMKIAVFCAGALGVRLPAFLAVIVTARAIRYGALAWLGQQMGENALTWINQHKWQIAGGLGLMGLALFVMIKIADRRRIKSDAH